MSLTVRSLAEIEDLEGALDAYHRMDSAAFGEPPDHAAARAKRPLIEPDRWYLAGLDGEVCGGTGSFPFELTVPGGATVPVAGVSDVGVLPTHRRRGVLSALMRRQLGELRERGQVAAVLHASEASIYRRFGYGTATRWRQVHVDTRRSAFRDDWPRPGGRYRMLPRSAAVDACMAVHDRARLAHAGALSRSEAWWRLVLGDTAMYIGGGKRRLVILHLDGSGAPDGYVIYEVDEDWSSAQASHTLRIWELVAASEAVELGLWRTVLDHDLVARVSGPIAVDHLLWEVMADPRQVRTAFDQDLLWARILDVPTALGARTYASSGTLTLEVVDRSLGDGGAGGTFAVEVSGGAATCEPVSTPAEVTIDVADLSACWLGGGSFRRLLRAGRLEEASSGAAARADAMFATETAPWCWVRF